jgi:hypothetical protein
MVVEEIITKCFEACARLFQFTGYSVFCVRVFMVRLSILYYIVLYYIILYYIILYYIFSGDFNNVNLWLVLFPLPFLSSNCYGIFLKILIFTLLCS